MTIFQDFRALVAAVRELATVLEMGVEARRELGPALERLDTLELSRHQFEAMVEGKLLQADGKLKAASNAEARERQLKKSYEKQLDPLDPDGEEATGAGADFPNRNGASGRAERLPALRLDMAPTGKALAVRAKFGMT